MSTVVRQDETAAAEAQLAKHSVLATGFGLLLILSMYNLVMLLIEKMYMGMHIMNPVLLVLILFSNFMICTWALKRFVVNCVKAAMTEWYEEQSADD